MAFSINSHEGKREKRSSSLKPERKTQKKKEKRKSGAEVLESCDHGSHPSSFLLLVLCSAQ